MRVVRQVIRNTISEYMRYRINFVLWRVRVVMQILVAYVLWRAVFSTGGQEIFGYSQTMMLTYILLTNIARTLVLGTRSIEVGEVINKGELSNFLIRPMSFLRYYVARDAADKLLNLLFAAGELTLLFLILRPPIFLQGNLVTLAGALIALTIGVAMYFFFSMILGYLGFWTADTWAPRFLSFVIIEFFSGGFFPLDILPKPLFAVVRNLPFSYFIYFPLKVYLGQLAMPAVAAGIFLGVLWVGVLWYLGGVLWTAGLRAYTAEGQ